MIHIARAPVRITLGGGGTDFPYHYRRFGGHAVGLAINRYVAVSVATQPWSGGVEFRSGRHERAAKVSELTDELTRAALEEAGISGGVQVTVTEDMPAGTGVGSSSAFTVALLAAACAVTGKRSTPMEIAEWACAVEMEHLARDVGKQDQYLCALGGLQSLTFNRDDTIVARDLSADERLATGLAARIRLYWNGQARNGHQVRSSQMREATRDAGSRERHDALVQRIAAIGLVSLGALEAGDFDAWGEALHEHWVTKRQLGVQNLCFPDELYERLRATASVSGGKLMGAGGHGIVLLYCRDDGRAADQLMEQAGFTCIEFGVARRGVEVLTAEGESRW